MQMLVRFIARVLAWLPRRRQRRPRTSDVFPVAALQVAIHREVTPMGVRVFSLCGSCGARLLASATLCDECAQRRSRLG
jgi:hypothetical protein